MSTKKSNTKVVIIGAGFSGLSAAKTFADAENVEVTILDRTNHHLFQPLLYQVATSTLTGSDIARSVRTIFKGQENVSVIYDCASDFDKEKQEVILASGDKLPYDYLIMATGAKTSFFGNDHWAEHVYQMKSLRDSYDIKSSVLKQMEIVERSGGENQDIGSTVVIVGGGPTGVELAGAFSDLICRTMKRSFKSFKPEKQKIILLEAQDFLLPPFQSNQREYTKKHLEKLGVDVRTGAMVANIEDKKVTLKDGEVIEAGTIIWTAGVEATGITKKLGAELSPKGTVVVTPELHIEKYDNVFVIGDCACVKQEDGSYVPGVAPAATQEGSYVAKSILKRLKKEKIAPFVYKDKGKMAIIGKGAAVVDIHGTQFSGFAGWVLWLLVHVMTLVDFRKRFTVLIGWFLAYITIIPGTTVFTKASDEDA